MKTTKMKTTKEELLAAIKECVAVMKDEVQTKKKYPPGTCNAEDAWRDFGNRERASIENLYRLAKCK